MDIVIHWCLRRTWDPKAIYGRRNRTCYKSLYKNGRARAGSNGLMGSVNRCWVHG